MLTLRRSHCVYMQHMVSSLSMSSRGVRAVHGLSENCVESSWNVMAQGDAREWKWRRNWRMDWVGSTLHTTSEHGVSSNTTADAHTSAAIIRLNWRNRHFKWTRPFRRKTKYGFCACAITFQTQSTARTPRSLIVSDDTMCCMYTQSDLLRMSIVLLGTCRGQ
jgi:hypothetical protein